MVQFNRLAFEVQLQTIINLDYLTKSHCEVAGFEKPHT